nr:hypothetical protein HK105_006701 [Polyrhizophydium stewartii]
MLVALNLLSAALQLLEAASLYVMAEQDHHIRNIILAIMFVGLLLTQLEMRMAFSALFQPADQAPLSITQKAGLRAGATLLHLTLMFPAYVASPADLDTILKMWFYAGSAVHTVLLSCVGCVQGYVIITALLKSSKHISAQVYRRKYIDLAVYLVLSVTAQLGVLGAFVMMSLNSTVKTKPVQQLFEQFGMACIGSEAVYTTIALRIMTSLLASNAQRPKHDSRRAKENKIETVAPEDDMPTTPANTEAGIRAMQQSTQDTQLASTHVRSK